MSRGQAADLIISGRVATLAGENGFGWQPGVAIGSGRVIAVGSATDLETIAGPRTRRWTLAEDTIVMPGITDAHLHLMMLVLAERQLDLTDADLPRALALIGARHREMLDGGDRDGWLLGHGWSLHALGRWPDAEMLEDAAPGRPIALYAHDHHSRWVSAAALRRAGIIDAAAGADGGLVRRGDDGRATGILHESASALVNDAIPDPPRDQLEDSLERVAAGLIALGLTGCHDPGELGSDTDVVRGPGFYRSLAARGRLPFRVHASIRAPQLEAAIESGLQSGQGTEPDIAGDHVAAHAADRYRMGWLKLFADGSLGSRSAALLEPYSDALNNPPTGGPSGMFLSDRDELSELLNRAAAAGISGQVHAIGDAAVRMALDVLAEPPPDARPDASVRLMRRIEHAQLVDPADVHRFGRLGIAASMQPVHLRSDAETARVAWGERAENAFPLRGLTDGGALIPFGTDAPVEPPDPWPGIAVAVARRDPFDADARPTGFRHSIDLARAIRAACLDPCLVAGQADVGRLISGYRADLVVVPADGWPNVADPAVFAATRPLATLIDGEVVYRSDRFEAS